MKNKTCKNFHPNQKPVNETTVPRNINSSTICTVNAKGTQNVNLSISGRISIPKFYPTSLYQVGFTEKLLVYLGIPGSLNFP